MLKFKGRPFTTAVFKLAMVETLLNTAKHNIQINWDPKETVKTDSIGYELLREMRDAVLELDARFTLKAIARMIKRIEEGKCTSDDLLREVRAIDGRLRDELEETHLFVVSADSAKYLDESKPLFGDEVSAKFPSASYDIEEAGKCLALRRSTACVTHLMRALEVALAALGKQFGVSTDHTNWHNIIDQIESKIKAMNSQSHGAGWKDEQAFYSAGAVHFRMLKDGWRNYAMHVREKYTEEQADDIYRSTRSFMRHLCQRLSEETVFS
jgi:hypothetical protein